MASKASREESPARASLEKSLTLNKKQSWFGSIRSAVHHSALTAKAAVESLRGGGSGTNTSLVDTNAACTSTSRPSTPRTTPGKQTIRDAASASKSAVASLRHHLSRRSRHPDRGSVPVFFSRSDSHASSTYEPQGPPQSSVRHSRSLSRAMSRQSRNPDSEADVANWASSVPLPSSPIAIPTPPTPLPQLSLDFGPPAQLSPFSGMTGSALAEIKVLQDPRNITTGFPSSHFAAWDMDNKRSQLLRQRPVVSESGISPPDDKMKQYLAEAARLMAPLRRMPPRNSQPMQRESNVSEISPPSEESKECSAEAYQHMATVDRERRAYLQSMRHQPNEIKYSTPSVGSEESWAEPDYFAAVPTCESHASLQPLICEPIMPESSTSNVDISQFSAEPDHFSVAPMCESDDPFGRECVPVPVPGASSPSRMHSTESEFPEWTLSNDIRRLLGVSIHEESGAGNPSARSHVLYAEAPPQPLHPSPVGSFELPPPLVDVSALPPPLFDDGELSYKDDDSDDDGGDDQQTARSRHGEDDHDISAAATSHASRLASALRRGNMTASERAELQSHADRVFWSHLHNYRPSADAPLVAEEQVSTHQLVSRTPLFQSPRPSGLEHSGPAGTSRSSRLASALRRGNMTPSEKAELKSHADRVFWSHLHNYRPSADAPLVAGEQVSTHQLASRTPLFQSLRSSGLGHANQPSENGIFDVSRAAQSSRNESCSVMVQASSESSYEDEDAPVKAKSRSPLSLIDPNSVMNVQVRPSHASDTDHLRGDIYVKDEVIADIPQHGPPSPTRSVRLPLRPKHELTATMSHESGVCKLAIDRAAAKHLDAFQPRSDPTLRQRYFPHIPASTGALAKHLRQSSLDSDDSQLAGTKHIPEDSGASDVTGVFERAVKAPSPLQIRKHTTFTVSHFPSSPQTPVKVADAQETPGSRSTIRTPSMGDRQRFDLQRAEQNARYNAIHSDSSPNASNDAGAEFQLADFGHAGPGSRGSTPKRDGSEGGSDMIGGPDRLKKALATLPALQTDFSPKGRVYFALSRD